MQLKHLLWLFIILQFVCTGHGKRSISRNLKYSVNLDFERKVLFQWSASSEILKIRITVPTIGWVGIGFSPSGTMKGADIIFAYLLDGKKHVVDMHGIENGLPKRDKKRNIRYSGMKQNGTHTTLFVNRFIDTCDDDHDVIISDGTTRVIFAYGDKIPVGKLPTYENYHGGKRGVKSLRLLDKKYPGLEKRMKQRKDTKSHEIRTPLFTIPKIKTYYHCFFHKLPDLDRKHHMIQFEPILTPGNEKNVHHINIYHCNESLVTTKLFNTVKECYVGDLEHWNICAPVVVSWATGMEAVTVPSHVGFPIGAPGTPRILKVEIHYDNTALESGMEDTSGIRVLYTPNLRKYDAGILFTGFDVWPTLFIPQGSKDYVVQGHCSTQCLAGILKRGNSDHINVFGVFLHSHTAAYGMTLKHYRNGTELEPIARDLTYDFDYQETTLLSKEKEVFSGDNLITECIYNTLDRKRPTMGGLETTDEMCFGFVMYYPKMDDAYCQSYPVEKQMFSELNAKDIREAYIHAIQKNWTNEDRQKFNRIQLDSPVFENCRTLSGPIEGLEDPHEIPKVTAKYVGEPSSCEKRRKEILNNGIREKSHDVMKRSQNSDYAEKQIYSNVIFAVGAGTVTSIIVLTAVGFVYYKHFR